MKKDDTSNFRRLLSEEIEWPHVYMFKFIIPSSEEKQAEVTGIFPQGAKFSFRPSRTGKYMSITVKALMQSPDEVIKYYKKAANIEGIMSL